MKESHLLPAFSRELMSIPPTCLSLWSWWLHCIVGVERFRYNACSFLLQQTKRKLDDASKRLEFLYDKLREQTVSYFWDKVSPLAKTRNTNWTAWPRVAGLLLISWPCVRNQRQGRDSCPSLRSHSLARECSVTEEDPQQGGHLDSLLLHLRV